MIIPSPILLLSARRIFSGFHQWIVGRHRRSGAGAVPRHLAFATPLGVLMFHPLIGLLPRLFSLRLS
jgi:hypothetical protein